MAGAATKTMPMHRQGVATNQEGRSSATGGGPELAARGVEDLVRSFGYALRPSSGGSTHLKAMKRCENPTGRLSGDRCTPVPTQTDAAWGSWAKYSPFAGDDGGSSTPYKGPPSSPPFVARLSATGSAESSAGGAHAFAQFPPLSHKNYATERTKIMLAALLTVLRRARRLGVGRTSGGRTVSSNGGGT